MGTPQTPLTLLPWATLSQGDPTDTPHPAPQDHPDPRGPHRHPSPCSLGPPLPTGTPQTPLTLLPTSTLTDKHLSPCSPGPQPPREGGPVAPLAAPKSAPRVAPGAGPGFEDATRRPRRPARDSRASGHVRGLAGGGSQGPPPQFGMCPRRRRSPSASPEPEQGQLPARGDTLGGWHPPPAHHHSRWGHEPCCHVGLSPAMSPCPPGTLPASQESPATGWAGSCPGDGDFGLSPHPAPGHRHRTATGTPALG